MTIVTKATQLPKKGNYNVLANDREYSYKKGMLNELDSEF